jgi:hypothetical protein
MDRGGSLLTNAAGMIVLDDLYLLAVLNSRSFWDEIARHCTHIQSGYQLVRAYLARCAVPLPCDADRRALGDLAGRCLEGTARGADISGVEGEIDARVARLYSA